MCGFNCGYHDLNVCYYGRPNCAEDTSHQSKATKNMFHDLKQYHSLEHGEIKTILIRFFYQDIYFVKEKMTGKE